jgi:hypothetical protein
MPDTLKPVPGIAWRKVQEQGILIHPRREIMIGLTEAGYSWWEALAAGKPLPEPAAGQVEFLRFLRVHGLLEPGGAEPPPADPGPLPAEVAWVEEFRPLAYTASCGRVPGGGGPCEPVPSGG